MKSCFIMGDVLLAAGTLQGCPCPISPVHLDLDTSITRGFPCPLQVLAALGRGCWKEAPVLLQGTGKGHLPGATSPPFPSLTDVRNSSSLPAKAFALVSLREDTLRRSCRESPGPTDGTAAAPASPRRSDALRPGRPRGGGRGAATAAAAGRGRGWGAGLSAPLRGVCSASGCVQ